MAAVPNDRAKLELMGSSGSAIKGHRFRYDARLVRWALLGSSCAVMALAGAGCASPPTAFTESQVTSLKRAAQAHFQGFWESQQRGKDQRYEAHVDYVGNPEPGETPGSWTVEVGARIEPTMRTYIRWLVVLRADGTPIGEPQLHSGEF